MTTIPFGITMRFVFILATAYASICQPDKFLPDKTFRIVHLGNCGISDRQTAVFTRNDHDRQSVVTGSPSTTDRL
jgi:hypothetical protein